MAVIRKGAWALENPIFFTPPPVRGRYLKGLWGGGSAPAAPDPIATANAQADANIKAAQQTAQLNHNDTQTPFGNTTWTNQGDKWTSNFQLNPQLQGLLDQVYSNAGKTSATIDPTKFQQVGSTQSYIDKATGQTNPAGMNDQIALAGQLNNQAAGQANNAAATVDQGRNVLNNAANVANLGSDKLKDLLNTALPQGDEAARQKIQDAYYSQQASRLDPQYKNLEDQMRSRLANQGITEGSEAYNRELQQFQQGRTDAYSTATNTSIQNSTAQMLAQIQGQLAIRGQGLNEATGAMNNYSTASGAYNQQMGAYQSALNGAMGANGNLTGTKMAQSQMYDAVQNRGIQAQAADQSTRSNQLNESTALHNLDTTDRNNVINNLMALYSGGQVQAPGSAQTQVAAAPVAQSIYNSYNGQLQAAQSSQSGTNSMLGAAGSLGAAAIMSY